MSNTNFSLIDLKALSEPAVKLIEAVRSSVGVLYEPTQIRRRAAAEADAAVILARNQVEVRDIEIRASERLRARELRRQDNVEAITKGALKALPESVSKDPVDEDWIHQFYEHCQDVGNEQMQHLWGKILAGEVAQPGSYSLRCLSLIRDIQQKDADTFTRFCTFVWRIQGGRWAPMIPDHNDELIAKCGISFSDFLHLEDMGLIQFGQITGYALKLEIETVLVSYFGKIHRVTMPSKGNFSLGCALLTAVGSELVPIAGGQPNAEYLESIIKTWRTAGYKIAE